MHPELFRYFRDPVIQRPNDPRVARFIPRFPAGSLKGMTPETPLYRVTLHCATNHLDPDDEDILSELGHDSDKDSEGFPTEDEGCPVEAKIIVSCAGPRGTFTPKLTHADVYTLLFD